MDVWSLFLFIVFFASIPLATEMARERARSRRLWFWIAFLVGPLAPIILSATDGMAKQITPDPARRIRMMLLRCRKLQIYTSSIRRCRPTACAARVSVSSVTDSLSGSSKRSS